MRLPVIALLAWLLPLTVAADEVDARYVRELALMKEGNLDEAAATLTEVLRARPGYDAAELTLANVLRKQRKCDLAIGHYEAVLKHQPKDPFANGNAGICYF